MRVTPGVVDTPVRPVATSAVIARLIIDRRTVARITIPASVVTASVIRAAPGGERPEGEAANQASRHGRACIVAPAVTAIVAGSIAVTRAIAVAGPGNRAIALGASACARLGCRD